MINDPNFIKPESSVPDEPTPLTPETPGPTTLTPEPSAVLLQEDPEAILEEAPHPEPLIPEPSVSFAPEPGELPPAEAPGAASSLPEPSEAIAIAPKASKKTGKNKAEAEPVKVTVKRIKKAGPAVKAEVETAGSPEKSTDLTPPKKTAAKKKAVIPEITNVATTKPQIKAISKKVAPAPKNTSDVATLKITFQLRYSTKFGETVLVTGNHSLLGDNDFNKASPLEYLNEEFWQGVVDIPLNTLANGGITYKYILRGEDGAFITEWGEKTIKPSLSAHNELLVIDSWNYAGYYENIFYTEPFKNVLFKNNYTVAEPQPPGSFTHTFKVKAPFLKQSQVLCLCGNVPELGGWNKNNVFLMGRHPGEDWWTVDVDLLNASLPIAYKYGVYNIAEKTLVELEGGNNRVLYQPAAENLYTIVADCFINLSNTAFRAAGVAIPVFSLRSRKSFGTGEFNDLKLLVDWAKSIDLKLIQVLPVNDTIATHTIYDSYPYAAISAFALHPLYLHLPSVIEKKNKTLLRNVEERAAALNFSPVVEYKEVINAKIALLKQIFALQKKQTFKTSDFKTFFETNAHWLVPYAAFSYFRDEYGTADFKQWPLHNSYHADEINRLATPVEKVKDEISIHYFIQYHLHLQLKEATDYAHANGVIVKGDIPIGIYRNSCDAWQQPELYNMDQQAGAPPDDFAVKGQNWGFPTYNWQRMAEDGFSWWKKRFAQMSYYFDAFRIDHILGFFRIWSIPLDAVEGIMGHFVPSLPVDIDEFENNSILFDKERFTTPFINQQVLNEIFGEKAPQIIDEFLEPLNRDYFKILPAFDTQGKVEAHFSALEQDELNQKLKTGLFDLISNVILFEEKESAGRQFHFRIAMDKTTSFLSLDPDMQYKLRNLYIHYLYHRQDNFWRHEAMTKLPELKRSTNMLIFGEDLGMVPSTVPGVMKDLGILSLEIQRMPKDPSKEFFHPNDAPYLSVVTPSTHDMSTIRAWWEEDREKTQRFYNNELGQYGKAPAVCEPWIQETIILQHLYSPAMWSIFQLQDLIGLEEKLRRENALDERINIPSESKHYWQYRMHLYLEDLIKEKEFNQGLKEYIHASGR